MEAAEALHDESILVNIRGQHLIAIEVRYHRSCYKVSFQELFIKTVREVKNRVDNVEIRDFYLKQKQKARYLSLQLLKPTNRNASEIVFQSSS